MARKSQAERVHDRTGADLTINSRVAIAIVDDPYSAAGEKIRVVRSIRHDPLADMLQRRLIDDALYLAGRKWQELAERCTIGAIRAIDPGKEAVDGGKLPEALTDSQIKAFRELNSAHKRLGEWGSALMRDLLENNMAMNKMAEKYGLITARQANFLSLRIRECLEDLAKLWAFAG